MMVSWRNAPAVISFLHIQTSVGMARGGSIMQSTMKLTLGKIIAASILFAAGLFLVMAAGAIYSIEEVAKAADWLTQAEEVAAQTIGINALVLDLESANLGF